MECRNIAKWLELEKSSEISAKNESLFKEFENLHTKLNYNSKFLLAYGTFLINTNENEKIKKGIKLIEESQKKYISFQSLDMLSLAYLKIENYKKSIFYTQKLKHLVPSKFGTRLRLIKLLKAAQFHCEAVKEAKYLLSMPVKIPSIEVDEIKRHTEDILKEYNDI